MLTLDQLSKIEEATDAFDKDCEAVLREIKHSIFTPAKLDLFSQILTNLAKVHFKDLAMGHECVVHVKSIDTRNGILIRPTISGLRINTTKHYDKIRSYFKIGLIRINNGEWPVTP